VDTPPLKPVEDNGRHSGGYKNWPRWRKALTWTGGVLAALVIIGLISNAVSSPKPAPASHVSVSAPAKRASKKASAPKVAAKPHKTTAPQAAGGCPQINSTLNSVFNGDYAGMSPAKTTGDLLNNFLGQDSGATSVLASIMAEHGTAPGLRSAEAKLNADVNTLDNTSYVSSAQSAVIVPDLKAIRDICGSAAWTGITLTVATGTPDGAPTTAPTTPATPTMLSQTDTVVFAVTGTGEPSVQYGNGATTNNPSGGAGPLGDGNYLPWQASMTYNAGAEYYAVTAQLEGSGNISDTVTEVITTRCSNGTHTESFPLANGSASGGYGIAQAEYTGGDTGNASQAESDAGC
jgi:hypothetical protein